jgi:hypothetical protein
MSLKMDEVVAKLMSKMPTTINLNLEKIKSTEVTMVAASVVGTISAIQLLTEWNPVGRCFTFWSQLRDHVSTVLTVHT